MKMNKPLKIIPLTVLLFGHVLLSDAAKPDSLFLSDEIIRIELRSNFTAIQVERDTVPLYHPGELIYKTGKHVKKIHVSVTSRGDFRRKPEICDFPPLSIDFKKKETAGTIFMNQKKLKLVTPCISDIDVIEEYLVYKMYNKITDMSLNVRLVNVTYYDTGKNRIILEGYSFFIEDEDHAASRNNAVETKKFMTPFDLERDHFAKLAIFQFMIGNKDWFVSSKKNIVLMESSEKGKAAYAVPYDFDFSGFVNAGYTRPKGVPQEYLADRRVFKGVCQTHEEFDELLDFFNEMEHVFISVIENMRQLPRNIREENRKYIEEFYSSIRDDEFVRKKFLETCETRKDYNLPY